MRMMRILSVLMAPFLFPSAAGASPVYGSGQWYIGDGGTYNASSYTTYPDAPFRVQNGTLDIGPGASVISLNESGAVGEAEDENSECTRRQDSRWVTVGQSRQFIGQSESFQR